MFYHCSPVPGIEELKPNAPKYFDKPCFVSVTTLLPMALFYGIDHFEYTYGYSKGKYLYYIEHFPDALKKLYKGKKAYLYTCEEKEDYILTQTPNEYVSILPVKITKETRIDDLYEELLKYEKSGNLKVIRYHELNDKNLIWIREAETEVILKKGLLDQTSPFSNYMKTTYPNSWEQAIQAKNKQR